MAEPNYVIILGKAMTGQECPWDDPTVDEVWGVNNVAGQPENCGYITAVGLTDFGKDYTQASVIVEGGGGYGAIISPKFKDGKIVYLKIANPGKGYTEAPKITITGDGTGAMAECKVVPKRKFAKLFAFDILDKEYTDDMKTNAPICSWQDYGDIKYPLAEVRAKFKTDYFTNTVSYMLAYAIFLGVKKIGVYGVDVAFGAPYAQENRGCEYWIGRAVEAGIEVYAPEQSQIMRTISGVIYGVKDACNVMLYLHERINLINALPREGHYSDSLKAQNAWWVLFPKEDEAKAHGVMVQRNPDGTMSFGFKNHDQLVADGTPELKVGEYLFDCHLPPEVWVFLRDILRKQEAEGKMNFGLLTSYEKLILAKPDGGN